MTTEKDDAPVLHRDGLVVREVEIRAVNDEKREATFIFSTDSVDRYGTRIRQNWRLDSFRKCPTVLYAHDQKSLPVGQAKDVGVRDGKLQGTILFASAAANPLAENVWQSIREGTLRATSVGFWPHSYHWEKEDGVEVLVLDDNELLEQSIVPIPGNAEALMQHFRALATGRANLSPPARAGSQETDMDLKEAQAALDKANQDLGAVRSDRDTQKSRADAAEARATKAETELTAERAQTARLVTERDAAEKRAKDFEDKDLERVVEGFSGVKFEPHEKDTMLKLARTNRELFDQHMAQRRDLKLLGGSVLGAATIRTAAGEASPPPVTGADACDDIADNVDRALSA